MPREFERVEEPYIRATTIVPKEYVGSVMELNNERRGRFDHMEYLSEERVMLSYDLPLAEIVYDYYDQLKSRTKGYASFDYDVVGFEEGNLVRVDILLAGDPVDALSLIVHRDGAYARGRALVDRLREEIPASDVRRSGTGCDRLARDRARDDQGAAEGRAREVLRRRRDRKRKLLERQKKGKKRMKQVGSVEVPQEAFLAVLNLEGTSDERRRRTPPLRPSAVLRLALRLLRLRHARGTPGRPRRYVDAVLAELELERGRLADEVETVFVGGGRRRSPSLPSCAASSRRCPGARR
jgi:translation elongation factor EF-4